MVMKESHICSCVRGEAQESAKGYIGISFDWIVGVYSCNLRMESHVRVFIMALCVDGHNMDYGGIVKLQGTPRPFKKFKKAVHM